MRIRTLVLGAVAALAVAAPCAALAAPWGYGDYGGYRDDDRGGPTSNLIASEDQIQSWIQRAVYNGSLSEWQAQRAQNDLRSIRRDTWREGQFHGGYMPADDYQRISVRLAQLKQFLRTAQYDGGGYRYHNGEGDDD